MPAMMPRATAAATSAYIAPVRKASPVAPAATTAGRGPSAGNSQSTGGFASAVDAGIGIEASVTNDESPGEAPVSRARSSGRFMTESDRDALDALADRRSELV